MRSNQVSAIYMSWTFLLKLVSAKLIAKLLIREIYEINSQLIINSLYSRWYKPYKDVLQASLIFEQVETNEYDRNAISIMFADCISKNVVGHVPFNWSKLGAKYLQFPNNRICLVVAGKRVNWIYLLTILFTETLEWQLGLRN